MAAAVLLVSLVSRAAPAKKQPRQGCPVESSRTQAAGTGLKGCAECENVPGLALLGRGRRASQVGQLRRVGTHVFRWEGQGSSVEDMEPRCE